MAMQRLGAIVTLLVLGACSTPEPQVLAVDSTRTLSIHGAAANDIWTSGAEVDPGSLEFQHWDGTTLASVSASQSFNPGTTRVLGATNGRLWLLQTDAGAPIVSMDSTGAVEHHAEAAPGATNPDIAFAAGGDEAVVVVRATGTLRRLHGGTFEPFGGPGFPVAEIQVLGPSDFLAADADGNRVARFDGAAWADVTRTGVDANPLPRMTRIGRDDAFGVLFVAVVQRTEFVIFDGTPNLAMPWRLLHLHGRTLSAITQSLPWSWDARSTAVSYEGLPFVVPVDGRPGLLASRRVVERDAFSESIVLNVLAGQDLGADRELARLHEPCAAGCAGIRSSHLLSDGSVVLRVSDIESDTPSPTDNVFILTPRD